MAKYILEQAGNINWMALFTLITFVTIFSVSVYMLFIKDKKEINHMAQLPLEDDDA